MKATYRPTIRGKERKLLKKIFKKCKGRISLRAQILVLATEITIYYRVEQITKICFCCKQTVYNTFQRYNEEGIIGLADKPKPGRPRSITGEQTKELLPVLEEKQPKEVGDYFHSKWTLRLVKNYLEKNWQVKTSTKTIQRWFHLNGWSYHRNKKGFVPNPLRKNQQDKVVRLLENIDHNKEVILFLDQTGFDLSGDVTRTWMPKGKQHCIPCNNNGKLSIYGAFNPHNTRFYFRITSTCNSEQMILFLHQICQKFPGKTIHLVLDNASFHHSADTAYFFHHHPEFVAHFLPVKSPRLNAIEQFWLFIKNYISAASIFNDLKDLYHTLRRFFWRYSNYHIVYNFSLAKTIHIWKQWPSYS